MDKLSFLGLNEREIRVFTALSTFGRMKMTKIAARAGVPRTTVDAIVRRLIEQGLVKKEKVRNHFEYAVVLNEVADTLDWIEKRLRTKREKGTEPKILEQSRNINDENIVEKDSNIALCSIPNAFNERSGDRTRVLLARRPDDIHDALMRVKEYVTLAAQTNTKLEILACSFVADSVKEQGIQGVSWDDPNLIRLNIVPASYCRAESDVLIFPDRVIVRDILGAHREEVQEPHTVEAMKHLLDIACEAGWSVNLSSWLGMYRQ